MSVDGDFEPLVSREEFARVQATLLRRGNRKNRHDTVNPDFPLRGFIRCASVKPP